MARRGSDNALAPMLKVGDAVVLRSSAEILRTLDGNSCLDGVPFMPEMLKYFGKAYSVDAKVERACDTIGYTGVRRLRDTVLLDDLRCDGSRHAGCGAQCRVYWKEAWLRPAGDGVDSAAEAVADPAYAELERRALAGVRAPDSTPAEPRFRCQATELIRASEPVGFWSFRSFIGEVANRNVSFWRFARVIPRIAVEEIGRRLGRVTDFPFRHSEMTARAPSPAAQQNLQPGQLVQIRTGNEISRTLNEQGKLRGLWFDREMKVYCGHSARVKAKVERFIDEGSGRLVELATDCYILDGVVCKSDHSYGRWFCPRAIYPWWREAWLEPIDSESTPET